MLNWTSKTAFVTGASAGIGREIARQLASDLSAIVLVARRKDRLEELAAELRANHPSLRVEVRPIDLLDRAATSTLFDSLEREGMNIDVLINNAGFGDVGLFENLDWEKNERLLELNVVSATYVLHCCIPGMIRRGFGAILNVGSSAGMMPGIGTSTYAASKAYLNHLSEALRAELQGTGVGVTTLCPGPVPTEFQEVSGSKTRKSMPAAFRVDVEACAREAILGLKRGRARVIPGAMMRAAVVSVESVPRALVRPFLRSAGAKARKR